MSRYLLLTCNASYSHNAVCTCKITLNVTQNGHIHESRLWLPNTCCHDKLCPVSKCTVPKVLTTTNLNWYSHFVGSLYVNSFFGMLTYSTDEIENLQNLLTTIGKPKRLFVNVQYKISPYPMYLLRPYFQTSHLPYRTKVFIGINVREIHDCQNRKRCKPTKNIFQQALDEC